MNIAEIDMYRILDNKAGLIVWTLFPTTGIHTKVWRTCNKRVQ